MGIYSRLQSKRGIIPIIVILILIFGALIGGLILLIALPKTFFSIVVWIVALAVSFYAGYKDVSRWSILAISFFGALAITMEWFFSSPWSWITTLFTLGLAPIGLFLINLIFLGFIGFIVHWLGSKIGGD